MFFRMLFFNFPLFDSFRWSNSILILQTFMYRDKLSFFTWVIVSLLFLLSCRSLLPEFMWVFREYVSLNPDGFSLLTLLSFHLFLTLLREILMFSLSTFRERWVVVGVVDLLRLLWSTFLCPAGCWQFGMDRRHLSFHLYTWFVHRFWKRELLIEYLHILPF